MHLDSHRGDDSDIVDGLSDNRGNSNARHKKVVGHLQKELKEQIPHVIHGLRLDGKTPTPELLRRQLQKSHPGLYDLWVVKKGASEGSILKYLSRAIGNYMLKEAQVPSIQRGPLPECLWVLGRKQMELYLGTPPTKAEFGEAMAGGTWEIFLCNVGDDNVLNLSLSLDGFLFQEIPALAAGKVTEIDWGGDGLPDVMRLTGSRIVDSSGDTDDDEDTEAHLLKVEYFSPKSKSKRLFEAWLRIGDVDIDQKEGSHHWGWTSFHFPSGRFGNSLR